MGRPIVSSFLVAVLGLNACAEGGEPPSKDNEPARQHYALIGQGTEKTSFILGESPPAAQLQDILAEERTEYWYTKIDVPHVAADGSPVDLSQELQFDLSDPSIAVRYAQTYRETCNPYEPLDEPIKCWLLVSFDAGEAGLEGNVSIRQNADGLRISYSIEYQGTYEKLGNQVEQPYPAEYGLTISGREAIASEFVEEVAL